VNIPGFPLGSKGPVLVTARRTDPAVTKSRFTLRVIDASGNVTLCDPVLTLQVREDGQPVSDTLSRLPQAEHLVTVLNGSPGVRTLHVNVNGRTFTLAGLKDGEERSLDVASAVRPGDANAISLTAVGKPGGGASIVVHD
jgi:hypothetical protein